MDRPIHFEYQEFKGITVVTLDSKLSDYGFHPAEEDGKMVIKSPEATVKDCRHIDGCVYFHLGRVADQVMTELIELFQKVKQEQGWKRESGLIVPDHKFKFD